MSIRRGTKAFPNSFCKRSASACLRTEPNTRNPFERSTFVVPHPIPVETPVTTTSLLFAISFLTGCYCRRADSTGREGEVELPSACAAKGQEGDGIGRRHNLAHGVPPPQGSQLSPVLAPHFAHRGRPNIRKMIASIQRSGRVRFEERGDLRVRPDQVTGWGTGRRHRPEDRQRRLRRRG